MPQKIIVSGAAEKPLTNNGGINVLWGRERRFSAELGASSIIYYRAIGAKGGDTRLLISATRLGIELSLVEAATDSV